MIPPFQYESEECLNLIFISRPLRRRLFGRGGMCEMVSLSVGAAVESSAEPLEAGVMDCGFRSKLTIVSLQSLNTAACLTSPQSHSNGNNEPLREYSSPNTSLGRVHVVMPVLETD